MLQNELIFKTSKPIKLADVIQISIILVVKLNLMFATTKFKTLIYNK
jgi:hypothetical protein